MKGIRIYQVIQNNIDTQSAHATIDYRITVIKTNGKREMCVCTENKSHQIKTQRKYGCGAEGLSGCEWLCL